MLIVSRIAFECAYAYNCERFGMLYTFLGGEADTWAHLPATSGGAHMRCFKQQHLALVALFVHACWRVRAEPHLDPEIASLQQMLFMHWQMPLISVLHIALSSDDEWFDVFGPNDTPRATPWLQVVQPPGYTLA